VKITYRAGVRTGPRFDDVKEVRVTRRFKQITLEGKALLGDGQVIGHFAEGAWKMYDDDGIEHAELDHVVIRPGKA
jgi:hypothetical protein